MMDNLKLKKMSPKEMDSLKGGKWHLINGVLVWIEAVETEQSGEKE